MKYIYSGIIYNKKKKKINEWIIDEKYVHVPHMHIQGEIL